MNAVLSNTVLPVPRSSTRSFTELKITPVILVCIHNFGNTPITHELLHTVFSTYGKILRILIFEKTKKWKAFVEYSDPEAAVQARENLDDFLLFSDGTRLNIYHSNLPTIKFQNNNSGGVDYTLNEEQPLFSYQRQGSLDSYVKTPFKVGSNGINSPEKRHFDHADENHYKSTDTGSHSHSAQHSSVDDDKEDEILKIIEDHKETFAQEEEENQPEEDLEKEAFNEIENAFFPFQKFSSTPNDFPQTSTSWQSTMNNPFFEPAMNANQRIRTNNSYTHLDFNQPSFQSSPPITRAGTFGELPTFHSFSTLPHFRSSNNLAQPKESNYPYPHGLSSFGQVKNTLNPKFPSQPELGANQFGTLEGQQSFIDAVEKDIIARIKTKLQSPEFQEYTQMNPYNNIDYKTLSQMDKEALLKLHSNLSAIVGKDSEGKKCAVLHVNGLEHPEIKVQMLYNIFSNFGNITKIIFMRNKASALIEFETVDYAAIAKDYLNNIVFMGKPLRINYSNYPSIQIRNKQNKGPEETFVGNQRTFRFNKNKNISINPPSQVLHISNLVKDACEDQSTLRSHFEKYGKVEAIKFLFGDNGKNMCLLKMPSIEDALKAMAHLHDFEIGGRRIQISFTRSKI